MAFPLWEEVGEEGTGWCFFLSFSKFISSFVIMYLELHLTCPHFFSTLLLSPSSRLSPYFTKVIDPPRVSLHVSVLS